MSKSPLRVDIISDVVCPWCIIGYRQLQQAVEATGAELDVHWHPFELNPNMPPEGQNLREHVMEKYGTTAEESIVNRERMVGIGKELDFTFSFSDESRMYNTFNAHQLLHWANLQGRENDLKQALFVANFTDRVDVGDIEVVADAAAGIGLDRAEALEVLKDQRFANDTRAVQQMWTQQGITGVPAMVFENKYLVSGAQGFENYTNILNQLADMKTSAEA